MEDGFQLEDMRRQIALLKTKLDQETIVNDRMIRYAVKSGMGTINRNAVVVYICAAFVIVFGSGVFYEMTGSRWFVAATILLMLTSSMGTYLIHRNVKKDDAGGDLLSVAKKMRRVKMMYNRWLYFGIPVGLLWLVWFFWETVQDVRQMWLGIAGIIGGVIGGSIGYFMHRKVVNTCDEIVQQIEG